MFRPIVAKRQARQAEREAVVKALAAAEAVKQLQVDRQTVERTVLRQIDKWRTLLATDGQQVLREALIGPIRFRPVGRAYHFDGRTATGKLIADLGMGDVSYLSSVPNGGPTRVDTRNPWRSQSRMTMIHAHVFNQTWA